MSSIEEKLKVADRAVSDMHTEHEKAVADAKQEADKLAAKETEFKTQQAHGTAELARLKTEQEAAYRAKETEIKSNHASLEKEITSLKATAAMKSKEPARLEVKLKAAESALATVQQEMHRIADAAGTKKAA